MLFEEIHLCLGHNTRERISVINLGGCSWFHNIVGLISFFLFQTTDWRSVGSMPRSLWLQSYDYLPWILVGVRHSLQNCHVFASHFVCFILGFYVCLLFYVSNKCIRFRTANRTWSEYKTSNLKHENYGPIFINVSKTHLRLKCPSETSLETILPFSYLYWLCFAVFVDNLRRILYLVVAV